MDRLKDLLYSLSATDKQIIQYAPERVQTIRQRWGWLNLFVIFITYAGSFHLFSFFFATYDKDNGDMILGTFLYFISMLLALVLTLLINLFNISMMGMRSKVKALFRIPVSLVFSTIIAIPLVLLFFNDNITQKLIDDRNFKIKKSIASKESIFSKKLLEKNLMILNKEINSQSKAIEIYRDNRKKHQERVDDSYDGKSIKKIGGRGTEYEHFISLVNKEQKLIDNAIADRKEQIVQRNKIEEKIDEYNRQIALESNKIEKTIKQVQQYDQVTKVITLYEMGKEHGVYKFLIIVVILFIMIIDLYPLIVKLQEESNDYDRLLEARNKLNREKIIALTNLNLHEVDEGNYGKNMMKKVYTSLED